VNAAALARPLWKKRLGESPRTSVKFVSVPLTAATALRAQIEVEYGGVTLRVREELDVERIARLVRALASVAQPC
jgi:hypothetical protein